MGYALIFSGQGMQHPAMLPWLENTEPLRLAAQRLEIRDWRERLSDPAWLSANRHAQLLLTACALAAWGQIAPHLPPPDMIAGYSVGEVAAYSAAGVFGVDTALQLAEQRAAAMDACALDQPGGMLGVTGLPLARVQQVCDAQGLYVAIDNGPMSCVLGGLAERLPAAELACQALGANCTRLPIGVASHTPLMTDARIAFEKVLASSAFLDPTLPLLASANATRIRDATQAKYTLAAQIDRTLLWNECMETLHARGVHCVLEVGAGHSLARLWNQRFEDVAARSVDEFRSVHRIAQWVSYHQGS